MKTVRFSPRMAVLPLALAAAFESLAQPVALPPTVVTATRMETRADELVSDVRIIDRQAIEASTAQTLAELLTRTAGVQMASNGGLGKQSSVFLRGTESRHTILLVDGVRVASATAGTVAWENIPIEMIERIEVLKGPASALYGSDAVGGVVQVFTRQGREGVQPHAVLTLGSRGYVQAGAGVAGAQGALRYSLGAQHQRERGASATNEHVPFGSYNPDSDPFRQDSLTASASYDIGRGWRLDGGLVYADGVSSFDDGPGIDARTALRASTAHAGVKGQPLPGWQTELRYARGADTSNIIEAAYPGAFRTEQSQWTWQNTIESPLGAVLAGLEQRVQKVSATTAYDVTRRTIDAAFVGVNGSRGNHSWQANLRHDRNSQFGGADTGFAGYGYRINPAWRVHASYGTSFVAPSFNQLYYPGFGNPALQPERGRNTDLGLTWTGGAHEVKLVRFDNRIRGFMTNTTLPTNVPRARIDGWSLGYAGKLDNLRLRADLESLDPRNELSGKQLPRRARSQATLGADYERGAWRFGGTALHVGSRFDDTGNKLALPAYTTLDLYAQWQLARDWSLQAKLNNVGNRHFETAYGYDQPGRGAYLTLRWQPK